MNRSKSLVFLPPGANRSDRGLPLDVPVATEGFELLGAPIGSPSFCQSSVARRISKIKLSLALLPSLHDSQMEMNLLRSCLSLPKLAYTLRTCDPDALHTQYSDCDSALASSLADVIGSVISEWSLPLWGVWV